MQRREPTVASCNQMGGSVAWQLVAFLGAQDTRAFLLTSVCLCVCKARGWAPEMFHGQRGLPGAWSSCLKDIS